MSETLTKLRPDRDLQCYFQTPSAIAALSATSPDGFTVSGCWRQQFDWAVLEWNRDNVFEHPQLRNLPDGDLSGLILSYEEERVNCIQADSTLFATVDWPSLRIWAESGSPEVEQVYKVPLIGTPVAGTYTQATASFTLLGTITAGDLIELSWDEEHYNYQVTADDTLDSAAAQLAEIITEFSKTVSAAVSGATITLTILPEVATYIGANGNRLGVYGTVSGQGGTESWSPAAQQFSGGLSPTKWAFSINFSDLKNVDGIPTNKIRKMRWTYAAELQPSTYRRSEFSVTVTNWSVTGTGLAYSVAGPGSRRIEDTDSALTYSDGWEPVYSDRRPGNFSGGFIQFTAQPGNTCTYQFIAEQTFAVYVGTRRAANCARLTVSIDGVSLPEFNLSLQQEDVLVRIPVGTVQPGGHALVVKHTGDAGTYLYFDFIDLVVPTRDLPVFTESRTTTLATDWDTLHSIAIAPERTAWLINTLGFTGRANHYVGALWFYELERVGHIYATATIQFSGDAAATPVMSPLTTLSIGLAGSGQPPNTIPHQHLFGDTPETIAKVFELRINGGYTSVWAKATGSTLTIQSRFMGAGGNNMTIGILTNAPTMTAVASSSQLTGGVDGESGGVGDFLSALYPEDPSWPPYAAANLGWRADLTAMPRINRACRDWSRSYFRALKAYGIEGTAAFSMELQHGDPAVSTGIAQRYPSGNPVVLTTPALQTNFSPTSLEFWREVYAEMAKIMADAGQTPYLQFGEVQWWYFAYDDSGLPFYDSYTQQQFTATYRRAMFPTITQTDDPEAHSDEAAFLPTLIGAFTRSIQQFVRQTHAETRFEVLYPCDTNAYPFTAIANLPTADWTASTLDCFKTENFTFTGDRNLVLAAGAIAFPAHLGFSPDKVSHLVGISGANTPWRQEAAAATFACLESVVLFALDQYCLIGYGSPAALARARSFMIP